MSRTARTLFRWVAAWACSLAAGCGQTPPPGAIPVIVAPQTSTGDHASPRAEVSTAAEGDSTAGSSRPLTPGTVALPLDRDGDRVEDPQDGCPDDPEDSDGFEDRDGCPDR